MLSTQHFQIVLQTVKVARSKPLSSHLLDLKGCIFQALAVVLLNLKGLISTYKENFPYPCRSFYLTHYGQILLPIPGIFSTPLKGELFSIHKGLFFPLLGSFFPAQPGIFLPQTGIFF